MPWQRSSYEGGPKAHRLQALRSVLRPVPGLPSGVPPVSLEVRGRDRPPPHPAPPAPNQPDLPAVPTRNRSPRALPGAFRRRYRRSAAKVQGDVDDRVAGSLLKGGFRFAQ